MASITWDDTDGSATLENGYEAPGGNFQGWVPLTDPVGPLRNALGTGIPYMWEFRADYGAKFTLRARLKRHLKRGNTVTVNTGDTNSHIYTMYLWPGADVDISGYDAKNRKRSVTLSLLNSEQADPICTYP